VSSTTDLPFGEALRELMSEHGITFRELSKQLQQEDTHGRGRGLSHAHLANLAHGRAAPSGRAIDLISDHFGLEPNYFTEDRLAAARARLDPATSGLDAAQAELLAIQRVHAEYPACPPAQTPSARSGQRCAECGLDVVARYGEDGAGLLETHVIGPRETTLVCPTCHRAAHSGLTLTPESSPRGHEFSHLIPPASCDPGPITTRPYPARYVDPRDIPDSLEPDREIDRAAPHHSER
jgi:transcriptional regulator with XRE-family HTH domain